MKNYFSTRSLRSILIFLCFPFVILSIIISIIFYISGVNKFSDLIKQNSVKLTAQATDNLSRHLNSIKSSSANVILDSIYFFKLNRNLSESQTALSPKEYMKLAEIITSYVTQNSSDIQLIVLKLSNNYINLTTASNGTVYVCSNPDYELVRDQYGEDFSWITAAEAPFLNSGINVPQIGLIKILGTADSDLNGYLYIGIKDDVLLNELTNYKVTSNAALTITHQENLLYYKFADYQLDTLEVFKEEISDHPESLSALTTGSDVFLQDFHKNSIIISPMESVPFSVLAVIPSQEMYLDSTEYKKIILAEGLLLPFLFLILFLILTRFISKPAEHLVNQLSKSDKPSLLLPIKPVGGKEFGTIVSAINQMLLRIQDLVDTLTKEMRNRQNAELSTLYSQINPHFLYNTLDSIKQLCELRELDSAQEMVIELSDFYRIGVSSGDTIITLKNEIKHVTAYLSILHTRYEDFDFIVNAESSLMNCKLPKIILQPLVENALYHGVRPSRMYGCISITCICECQNLKITVSDNGVGMEATVLEQLKTSLTNNDLNIPPGSTSYGLRNVDLRLKLEYGYRYGVSIDSHIDEGTTITLLLPLLY